MLIAAFTILGIAILLGLSTWVLYLYAGYASALPGRLAPVHGLFAIAGFLCLILALNGPPRQAPPGTASFGNIAAVFLALAALVGGAIFVAHLRGKSFSQMAFGIHATLAVSGFVILAAYIFAG